MDWSTVTFVRLGYNPLVTFAFVELSPQLAFFEIKDCPISNFTVTPQTYAALNALKKWDGDTDNYAGFVVTNNILTSSSDCAAINGQIRSLWATSASYTISVCVASPGTSSVDPSSAPAPVTKAPLTKVPSPSSGSQKSGNDKDSSSGANTGLIVGLIIGGLVIIVLVVLLIRRHQSDKTPPVTAEYQYAPPTTQAYVYQPMEAEPYHSNYAIPTGGSGPFVPPRTSTGGSGGHVASSGSLPTATSIMSEGDIFLDVAPLRPHKLELADLTVISERPISSGAYGEVWLGQHGNQKVAIKKLKDQSPASVFQFIEEIKLLSRMNSDFIVKFVGASWRRPIEMECVVEYMDLGDLRNYLATNSPAQFGWDQKLKSIVSIVRGLVYLHTFSPPIIHRDLKSRNVLLDSKKGTKLTDFGSSREIDESTLTNGVGTYQWMAPEIIIGTEYTQYIITKVTTGQLTPTLDETHTPTWVREMAAVCLQNDPASRPTSMQLAAMLQRL
ncbi:TKL protein kinase [Saprolegnia parasitica CBS 223.65]|uniref:TKL protein kinase n=1 Tax=Saprolegnia parasitica (strain CBS 223.65) TaxID=695850 RepID=A0A067BZ13_SAPPC|nr:TKL protein kinase [Saprolegnia parasitica CBS 223.65]KDO19561.1 TKL protein kinase [Saprolegnia parasitica CBS 223.65]|eukprot:XP_012209750.1 TKL protein kinase [Saprolegnia parasitica CBS 223.65]